MAQRFNKIVVETAKLRDYCLSEAHPRGRHKARVFRSRLGLTGRNAGVLRDALLHAAHAHSHDLQLSHSDEYGDRYVLDFEMKAGVGTATIRSAWIVLAGEDVLRLITCYVR